MVKNFKNISNKPGFERLMALQEAAEHIIQDHSHVAEQLLWEIYIYGQEGGIIQGLLQVAKAMQQAGFSRKTINELTGIPEIDLTMWEEVSEKA